MKLNHLVGRAGFVATLASLVLVAAGHGQEAGRLPGIDATRLQAGTDSMAIYLIRGTDTIPTGLVWETLAFVAEGGQQKVHRIYRSVDRVLGARLDTLVDNSPNLSPVRQHTRSSRGTQIIDYGGGQARGWIRLANGDSVPVEVTLPEFVYGAASFDLVLRAAPLADGWNVEVPSFLASTRTVVPLRARVTSQERVGSELCWRVDADFAGSAVSFWISQRSRRLCQQVMHLRPGVQVLFGAFPRAGAPPAPRA